MKPSLPPEPIARMLAMMAQLRHPQLGCPWSCQQNFQRIVPHTLEEAYEVADAIERGDYQDLLGELGDLLFQVVFYAQLGQEQGQFDFLQIVEHLNRKLTERHPHVFGEAQYEPSQWEAGKAQARMAAYPHSWLADVPLALPALTRAAKLQRRAAQVGFDWDSLGPVVDKVVEELDEVLDEAHQADLQQHKLQEEVGDLLFSVVNLARHLEVDAEQALRQANQKFERRFAGVESHCQAVQISLAQASLAQLEQYWQQVKQQESK